MAIKQFKTESKRLLDLMANSIYTNTDIFLRELISNASDALDKRYYQSLTDSGISADDLKITIRVNKDERTLVISDNGIGMNKEDLDNNLGTIAKSGSFEFKQEIEDKKDDVDIIGQFGVGFYSAFMVADKVTVISKKAGEEKAYSWVSENQEGYEIKVAKKEDEGTEITLHIKPDTKEKNYSDYLDKGNIKILVKKYSDYIRYPIILLDEDSETLNSMVPIWKKNKKDIKDEDYDSFYQQEYFDFEKPLKTIHYKVEGNTSYTALLYIPAVVPYNYYSADYKLGLKLYSRGVFIKDEAKEIVSDYFRFVRGVVDSDDLNLNIYREILQQDHQMNVLKKSIDKKIKTTLENMLKNERETYEKFFDAFGIQLKNGVYERYGMNKDVLIDLILFKSSFDDKYVSLKEYVERMKEGQEDIYYASGESIEKIKKLPQMEKVLDKGFEVLYLTDNIDEFMLSVIGNYAGKNFKSISKGDLDLDSEEEKKEVEEKAASNKDLLDAIKEILKDKVAEIRLSNRLKSQPVCLVSGDELSFEMETVLNELNKADYHARRILEINPDHELFSALKKTFDEKGDISDYAMLLYDQASLMAGLSIDDSVEYSKRLGRIMLKAMK